MFFITNRSRLLLPGFTVIIVGFMLTCIGRAAELAEEPRYLDVSSQGYSRYEISESDVVAFYADGVDFTYLNIQVSADNLRYNHANQEAIVEGVAQGRFDNAVFSCSDLYLNGARGVMEITGGAHVEFAGTTVDCDSIKANFPGGETRLELSDLIVVAGPGVEVTTSQGHRVHAPELTFNGQDMMVTTDSMTRLELALEDVSLDRESVLALSGLNIEFASMFCQVDEELNPLQLVLKHITGVSEEITFTASDLQAMPLDESDGAARNWDVALTNMDGQLAVRDDWFSCAAVSAECRIDNMELAEIELNNSVRVHTNKGAFYADRARVTPTADGFELILPDEVAVEFNLAKLSGQDPIEFDDIGEDADD